MVGGAAILLFVLAIAVVISLALPGGAPYDALPSFIRSVPAFAAGSAGPSATPRLGTSPPSASPFVGATPTTPLATPSTAPTEPPATAPPRTQAPGPNRTPKPSRAPTAEPKPTPAPTAAPTDPPAPARIVSFTAPAVVDCTLGAEPMVHVEWTVRRATGVTLSIDGGGIYREYTDLTASDDVPFDCGEAKHDYRLATTGGTGEPAMATAAVGRAAPAIIDFRTAGDVTVDGTTCSQQVEWEIRYATGAGVAIDGDPYNLYGGTSGSDTLQFECPDAETVQYRLTTTGGFGDSATATIDQPMPAP